MSGLYPYLGRLDTWTTEVSFSGVLLVFLSAGVVMSLVLCTFLNTAVGGATCLGSTVVVTLIGLTVVVVVTEMVGFVFFFGTGVVLFGLT